MSIADHGWRGRSRIRVARVAGTLVLRLWRVGTKAGKLKSEVSAFFRSEDPGQRPASGPMTVSIWIVGDAQGGRQPRFDVDNVAKACLDALTGPVWIDDSQVQHLSVSKLPAGEGREANAIYIAVTRKSPEDQSVLEDLLAMLSAAGAAGPTGRVTKAVPCASKQEHGAGHGGRARRRHARSEDSG